MSIYTSGNPSKWDYLRMVAEVVYDGAGWAEKSTIALWALTWLVGAAAVVQGELSAVAFGLMAVWATFALVWMAMSTINKQLMVGLGQSVIEGTAEVTRVEE